MANRERRLTRLATALNPDVPSWAEWHQAQRRQAARVRLVVGTRLGLDASDPCLADTQARLVGDTPARRAADDDLTARWDRAHGVAEGTGTARERILEQLARMAHRMKEQA